MGLEVSLNYETDKNSYFGITYTHFGLKVKRNHVVFSLVLQIGSQSVTLMKSSRRALFIGMPVCGPILKTSKNT